MQLTAHSAEEWKTAGNIALQCKGSVLLIGWHNSKLPLVISSFGHKVYGIDKCEKIEKTQRDAFSLGISLYFSAYDNFKSIPLPDCIFNTAVIGIPVLQNQEQMPIVEEAFRLVCDKGRIIFIMPKKMRLTHSLSKNIPIDIEFTIPQRDNMVIAVATKNKRAGNFVSDKNKGKTLNDFFVSPFALEQTDASRLVTIVIPTYNRAGYLAEAIESAINQTYKNTEIIVVDDGSTDSTKDTVSLYSDKVAYFYKSNGGKSSALNLAIKKASGDYVWYLDDDDLALPEKLELQMRYLQKHPEIDILFTGSLGFRDTGSFRKIEYPYFTPKVTKNDLLISLLEDCIVTGQSALVKKKCYEIAGPFRIDLLRSQDHEMWIRMARLFNMDFLNFPTVLRRLHEGQRSDIDKNIDPHNLDLEGVKYGRLFFKELYSSITYNELVPDLKDSPEDIRLKSLAIVEKGLISALYIHGDYAVSEFKKARDLLKSNNISIPLRTFDKFIIVIKRLITPSLKQQLQGVFYEAVLTIKYLTNCNEILSHIIRRCYWNAIEYLKSAEFLISIKWFTYVLKLIFMRGIFLTFSSKNGSK